MDSDFWISILTFGFGLLALAVSRQRAARSITSESLSVVTLFVVIFIVTPFVVTPIFVVFVATPLRKLGTDSVPGRNR